MLCNFIALTFLAYQLRIASNINLNFKPEQCLVNTKRANARCTMLIVPIGRSVYRKTSRRCEDVRRAEITK